MTINQEHKKDISVLWGSLIVVSFTLIYNLYFFNRYIPMTDGWYTYLVRLLNEGHILYKDVPFVFPPVYVYLVKWFIGFFGESFYRLHLAGVGVALVVCQLLFLIYRQFFSNTISVFVAIFAVVLFMEPPVYAPHDYYHVFSVFALGGFYCLLLSLKHYMGQAHLLRFVVYGFLGGILAGLGFLIRQSSGFFTMVLPFLALWFIAWRTSGLKKSILVSLPYLSGAIIVGAATVLWLLEQGSLTPFLQQTTGAAVESKGGSFMSLFGWVREIELQPKVFMQLIALCSAIPLYVLYNWLKTEKANPIKKKARRLLSKLKPFLTKFFCDKELVLFSKCYIPLKRIGKFLSNDNVLFMITIAIIPLVFEGFISFPKPILRMHFYVSLVVVANFLILFVIAYKMFISKAFEDNAAKSKTLPLYFVMLAFSAALSWGTGTSAVVSLFGAYFLSAFTIGYILNIIWPQYFLRVIFILLFVWLSIGFWVQKKTGELYNWWGLSGDSIKESIYPVNNPYLEGLYTSKKKKFMLESAVSDIQKYTNPKDDIFVFSQVPLFYVLSDRKSFAKPIVHWFDVCPNQWVYNDIELLKTTKPKVIVYEFMTQSVLSAHEKFFRSSNKSAQRDMMITFDDLLAKGEYKLAAAYDVPAIHSLFIMVRKDVFYAQKRDIKKSRKANIVYKKIVKPLFAEKDN